MEVVLKDVYKQVSQDLGISVSQVQRIYLLYWRLIKLHIESLPLKQSDSLLGMQTNINIHRIGKLWCDPWDFNKLKKHYSSKNEAEED